MPDPTPDLTAEELDELDERLVVAVLALDEAAVSDLLARGASPTRRRTRTAVSVGPSHTPLLLTGTLESALNDEPDSEFRKVPLKVVRACRDAVAAALESFGRDEAVRRLWAIRIALFSHVDGPLLG